ncbi:MAG: hypothetical protein C4527_22470 [Candidatus Omnitrophota bacterium]|jgi:uroporphyrinogen-III decarboxylase|nr:MAG: hypothetical protein C4527_22470 [Candidatus Omnitrophota bacterium]
MKLTSQQRLLKTFRREPVDRVPISTYELLPFGADSWYENQPSYRSLLQFIGENTDILYLWERSGINKYRWDEEIVEWREGKSTFQRYTLHTPVHDLTRLTRRDDDLHTTWTIEPLFKTLEDMETYYALPWEFGGVDMSSFEQAVARLGDRGVMLCDTMDPVCTMAYALDFEPFMILAWQERARLRKFMDLALERLHAELRYKLEHGAGPVWRIYGPEYISPPYFPPDVFRELVLEYDKAIIDLIHEYGGYVRLHSHGNVSQLLDQFIEMGADATDPLEPPPQGDVDLGDVKKRYGESLILFGNIELAYLEYWQPEQIETYVKQSIDAAAEGGGYVIMPTAAPINAPLWQTTERNYYRLIETALNYGRYE